MTQEWEMGNGDWGLGNGDRGLGIWELGIESNLISLKQIKSEYISLQSS